MSQPTWNDRRLSFGAKAAEYASNRPGYPAEAVDWALASATIPVRTVADVGAGAGALTRDLVARGLEVHAVEPDEGMLIALAQAVPDAHRHLASAESLPLADASVDAITVAQAWHWMDHHTAAGEFARVLRPGGVAAVVWNIRNLDVPWMAELGGVIGGEDSMRGLGEIDDSLEREAFAVGWGEPEVAMFDHEVMMTADSLVALTATYSYVRLRPDVDEVQAQVRRIGEAHAAELGSATFAMPYRALVIRVVRA